MFSISVADKVTDEQIEELEGLLRDIRFADLLPEGTSMSVEFKDMVPVEGVPRLVTDTGLFLLVQNRLLFLDATYMQPLNRLTSS